jgi:hypothetical protein
LENMLSKHALDATERNVLHGVVIPPFLVLTRSRGQAARANFCLGVIPPRAIFGRS